MASSVNNPGWLEWMAGLMGSGVSRNTHAATFLPGRFYCLLDELPMHLVPRPALKALQSMTAGKGHLRLNPECRLMSAEVLPEELDSKDDVQDSFALHGTMAWVRDATIDGLLPFWVGPKYAAYLGQLGQGKSAGSIPTDVAWILTAAGILVPEASPIDTRQPRADAISQAHTIFRRSGYAPLPGIIHPFHVAALRRYYRHLIRSGAIQLGDGQSPRRYIAHNDLVARFFHRQIAPLFSAIAGEPLKPSYVYLASYLS